MLGPGYAAVIAWVTVDIVAASLSSFPPQRSSITPRSVEGLSFTGLFQLSFQHIPDRPILHPEARGNYVVRSATSSGEVWLLQDCVGILAAVQIHSHLWKGWSKMRSATARVQGTPAMPAVHQSKRNTLISTLVSNLLPCMIGTK